MRACCELVEKLGGQIIGISFLIELLSLNGRERLSRWSTYSVLSYA